jgi:ribosomal protein S18 acetylase RimI-like enzyme
VSSTPTLYLRLATAEDIDLMMDWRAEAAAWVAEQHGSDQWSVPYPRQPLLDRVAAEETVMASLAPDADPVATITVSAWADAKLWTPAELDVPARYLYKASVARQYAGAGIGRTLIQWGHNQAAAAGAQVVRCDVWSSNQELQDYYKRLGFRYLRTMSGTNSGALFEASTTVTADLPIVELGPGHRPELD